MRYLQKEEEWRRQALCIRFDTDIFFPTKGENDKERSAKKICNVCTVKQECLDYALAHIDTAGIWGGTSHRERKMIRSRLRRITKPL